VHDVAFHKKGGGLTIGGPGQEGPLGCTAKLRNFSAPHSKPTILAWKRAFGLRAAPGAGYPHFKAELSGVGFVASHSNSRRGRPEKLKGHIVAQRGGTRQLQPQL